MRGPPWKSLGMCRRVTNKGKSGFSKANDRVKAKEQRPYGILGGSVVECHLSRREKARPLFKNHYRVPSLYPKRSSQALRPGDWRPVPAPRDSESGVPLKIFDQTYLLPLLFLDSDSPDHF